MKKRKPEKQTSDYRQAASESSRIAEKIEGERMPKTDRIETLKERKAKIEKQLAALEAKEKAKARKEDTRLKVVIGAGLLADAKIHPEILRAVQKILDRAITAKRDRELLQAKGWLPGETAGNE